MILQVPSIGPNILPDRSAIIVDVEASLPAFFALLAETLSKPCEEALVAPVVEMSSVAVFPMPAAFQFAAILEKSEPAVPDVGGPSDAKDLRSSVLAMPEPVDLCSTDGDCRDEETVLDGQAIAFRLQLDAGSVPPTASEQQVTVRSPPVPETSGIERPPVQRNRSTSDPDETWPTRLHDSGRVLDVHDVEKMDVINLTGVAEADVGGHAAAIASSGPPASKEVNEQRRLASVKLVDPGAVATVGQADEPAVAPIRHEIAAPGFVLVAAFEHRATKHAIEGQIIAAPAGNRQQPPQVQILTQLLHHAAKGQRAEMQILLTPEDLGHLRFQIQQQGETVRVVLSVERPETLELMRRHGDQLIQEFRQAGFDGATLSFGHWGPQENPTSAKPRQPLDEEMLAVTPPPLASVVEVLSPGGSGLNLRL